jgi:hypothetical protein
MPGRSTQEPSTAETGLALLVLPALDGLTVEQVRGASCIWCETPLTAETAVDLHERRHKRLDGHFSTFPRACRPCARAAADNALGIHLGGCEQCVDNIDRCATAAALRDLRESAQ